MSEINKPSLRIDWFDGTLIEDSAANTSQRSSNFADEEPRDIEEAPKPKKFERKPIGFKKLLDLSFLNPPSLTLEISHKSSFWLLLDTELKGDFIVLIVKILCKLYRSLEIGEKSLISNILKTNIEKSKFLEALKNYVVGLPSVRIVEKRINLQLWEDVELFYRNVLFICEVILDQDDYSTKVVNEVIELVANVEESVVGVKGEHSERFSQGLFEHIIEVKSKCIGNTKQQNTLKQEAIEAPKDPNHFKNLNIYPTRQDLLSDQMVNIQPNIINGCYPSVEQYLDIQFKLLREDYFGPLREGLCKYMQDPSKRRHENIRVHPKVRIIRMYVSNNKVGHLVDIAWHQRRNNELVSSKKHATNKQLMFGSLLLFTPDNFETILCATVLDSSVELLEDGYIAVTFESPVSSKIYAEPYLMVESEVFFEPYHRVLKVLQKSKLDYLPMQRYIVHVQTETKPPAYLNSETIYSITEPGKEETCFPVLDPTQWPNAATLSLDESQMTVFKHALTKEFAVIHGPPGTGKTFIGIKIASTILRNLSLEGTPMLIICYTNHALDQFLEGILPVTQNIIRLGSQSKNKALGQYTLHSLRGKVKCRHSYLYSNKRKELEKLFNEMTEVQTEIEKCEKEIVCYSTIRPYLKMDSKTNDLKMGKDDRVLSWLFGHLEDSFDDDDDEIDHWGCRNDEDNNSDEVRTCFSSAWASSEIESLNRSMKYLKEVTDDESQRDAMTSKIEANIRKIRKRLNCFKKYINAQLDLNTKTPSVKDLYELNEEQRWIVYFKAVNRIKDDLTKKMNALVGQYKACNEELDEVATLIDGEVMKTCRVVGVTTTVAARRRDLLNNLNSTIVIVEEAAEVLEAHIVASLTKHCQHLILIGDHKQLRPTAAHYKLAKECHLEISLFERMMRNGVHARALTTQRRMRPEFLQLIVPAVYHQLHSHPAVFEYPNVRGMGKNLYFYTHNVLEDSEGIDDSWSHQNSFEANWCVSLASYLRQMDYKAEDITILSTYTGQASLIKELSKTYNLLHGVKITVVDNFQGEESRIVILSLVRSNRDGKIGFLNATNRICVALSRAKEGFYIFGNMDILKSANKTWRVIDEQLILQECIGKHLTLRCDKHDNILNVESSEDLDVCLNGTCLSVCDVTGCKKNVYSCN